MPEPVESILKTFSFSFLLRSLLAGAFFPISWWLAACPSLNNKENMLSVGLPLALIAGVTVYVLHRSVFYPLLEYMLDSLSWTKFRREYSLISRETLKRLSDQWGTYGEEKDRKAEQGRNCVAWADYSHFQYTAAFCILLGGLVALLTSYSIHCQWWLLFILAILLLVGAFLSDWRLRTVHNVLAGLPDRRGKGEPFFVTKPSGEPRLEMCK